MKKNLAPRNDRLEWSTVKVLMGHKIMKDDKTISRIRTARHEISAQCGHSIERLGKYYMRRQLRHKNKLFSGSTEANHAM